jgi:DNA-binding response OmpR family regulator
VLVADDDERLRELLKVALELDGHQVHTAADGRHALACAQSMTVDAIILDVTMPGLTGLEVCRELRLRGDQTPVLMISGLTSRSHQAAGLAAGAGDYLTKPFDIDELSARLRELMRPRHPHPSTEEDR